MNWNRALYFVLALTILGQMTIGLSYLVGQGMWLVANLITVWRDFALDRPRADKVKDVCMLCLTIGLIAIYLF